VVNGSQYLPHEHNTQMDARHANNWVNTLDNVITTGTGIGTGTGTGTGSTTTTTTTTTTLPL